MALIVIVKYDNLDIGIFVGGSILDKVLELDVLLKKQGINVDIISFPVIKPIEFITIEY